MVTDLFRWIYVYVEVVYPRSIAICLQGRFYLLSPISSWSVTLVLGDPTKTRKDTATGILGSARGVNKGLDLLKSLGSS